jgi:serine/threonine-protein kinase TNNI3K
MSNLHRFWGIYEDADCSGAPTGVFAQRRPACESQVASSGSNCVAQYDSNNDLVGYVDESCRDGPALGLDELFGDVPYVAYDYSYDASCTDYENSAAYRASGDCETMYDPYLLFRSATISISSEGLVWKRNMGSTDSALNCPGSSGPGYYEFDVPMANVNTGACNNYENIDGGFVFYNTSAAAPVIDPSFNAGKSSSSSAGNDTAGSAHRGSDSGSSSSPVSTESGLAVGTVVVIVGGVAVLVVTIIVLGCCLLKRRRSGDSSAHSLENPFLPGSSAQSGGTTADSEQSTLGQALWNDSAIVANRVPRDKVNIEGLLCRGGFGEIYRGTYNREAVAIKMLFPDMRSDLKKVNLFLAEAKLSASFNHPHIVRFVGVSWGSLTDLCLLSELMKGGDLRTLLKEYEERGHPQGFDHDKIRIAYHVAQALTYLHSMSPIVVHRDLKSKNVLLTEVLDAKLTDFGVSRERQEHTMTAGVGTMLWMAPEVMMAEHYDERADIFSFGVLLSELDSQSLPYAHARCDSVTGKKVPDAVIIQRVASGALKAAFSPRCVASVVKLGNECLALDPSARPSAPMAVFRLQKIMKKHFSDEYII